MRNQTSTPLPNPTEAITLPLRGHQPAGTEWQERRITVQLPLAKTALLICDLWDRHYCQGAVRRGEEIAQRLAPLVQLARQKGILIIHAPSDTMPFYVDQPARLKAISVEKIQPPPDLVLPDPQLPIDDQDGGCDTDDPLQYAAYTRQNPLISIEDCDLISDNGVEIFSYLKGRGIENILYTGVHTNMCVLNRSFGIKQMRRWGVSCILVRDLTDTMYDPKDRPFVSHEEGTHLVIQHIEKYWAQTTTAEELTKCLIIDTEDQPNKQ